ncbi:hypothetical protein J6500_21320 [Bradyrhizobium sp. WSM 1704]|nr:hypothetical protein [Bradyrhizobium semiaridum]
MDREAAAHVASDHAHHLSAWACRLGLGLPLALGAKLARPHSEVIAVVGDGGFAHAWSEMETALRSEIPVTVVVLNNGVLGYQKNAEKAKFGRYTSSGHLRQVDHAIIARAVGALGRRIVDPQDLDAALAEAAAAPTLSLIDVITDPEAHPPVSLYEGPLDRMVGNTIVQDPVP